MHTLKNGYTILTFFIITMIVLCGGIAVIRSYSFSTNIILQQYNYWRSYYAYEGCLEYVFASFCNDGEMTPPMLTLYQQGMLCTITVSKTVFQDTARLKGDILCNNSTVASWDLLVKKNEKSWVMHKSNITLKSLY